MKRKTDKKVKKNLSNLFLDWQKSLERIARREEAKRLAGKFEESAKVTRGRMVIARRTRRANRHPALMER